MSKDPDKESPAEMPKDLDRVYAALDPAGDTAPDALLERILASRAAGERTILPAEHTPPSRLRRHVMRGAIAAVLGLVALAAWSRLSRSHKDAPRMAGAAAFAFPGFGDFGFGTPASAQEARGGTLPKYEPMVFDTSRLHPLGLRYLLKRTANNKEQKPDTLNFKVARSTGPAAEWMLVGEYARIRIDTVSFDRTTLATRRLIVTANDGEHYRITIDDSTINVHGVQPRVRYRPGTAVMDTTIRTSDTVVSVPRSSRYPRILGFPSELILTLMAAPIEMGWKRSLVMPGPSRTTDGKAGPLMLVPVDLEVVGEGRCALTTRPTDCWKVRRHSNSSETIYLVRKRDGVLTSLRTDETFGGKRFTTELALIGEP